MAKIIIHIPPPEFTLTELQQAFDISLETAFLIRRLIWHEFAPEEFIEVAPILQKSDELQLSEPEKILLVVNEFIGGLGLKYLRERSITTRYPYINRGDREKLTLFSIPPTFDLSTLAEVLREYRLIEEEDSPVAPLC